MARTDRNPNSKSLPAKSSTFYAKVAPIVVAKGVVEPVAISFNCTAIYTCFKYNQPLDHGRRETILYWYKKWLVEKIVPVMPIPAFSYRVQKGWRNYLTWANWILDRYDGCVSPLGATIATVVVPDEELVRAYRLVSTCILNYGHTRFMSNDDEGAHMQDYLQAKMDLETIAPGCVKPILDYDSSLLAVWQIRAERKVFAAKVIQRLARQFICVKKMKIASDDLEIDLGLFSDSDIGV